MDLYRVGKVVKISGTNIEVEAYNEKNSKTINYNGEILRNIQNFGYVAIKNGFDLLIGEITGEYTEYIQSQLKRLFTVKILGYIEEGKYISGIEKIAMIDNNVYLLNNDLNKIIQGDNTGKVALGKSVFSNTIMNFDANKLFASHIGIFGNTGSGKSYTLAKLLEEYFLYFPSDMKRDKNYLIDLTGEYENLELTENIKKYKINGQNTEKPKIQLDIDTLAILLNATDATQKPLLKVAYNNVCDNDKKLDWNEVIKAIVIYGNEYLRSEFLTIISPELGSEIKQYSVVNDFGDKKLMKGSEILGQDSNISKLEDYFDNQDTDYTDWDTQINLLTIDKLYIQLLAEASKYSNLEYIITLIQRFSQRRKEIINYITFVDEPVEIDEERLTIYDLSSLSSEYKKIVATLLVFQKYTQRDKEKYFIKIILDEAHNILANENKSSDNFSEFSIKLFKKILKEGRKDNVFAYISSQRPSEIDETIISQLHNFFIHNLKNYNDIAIVEKAIPFMTKDKLNIIPGLANGTALFAGLSSERSDIFKVDLIRNENNIPSSQTINIREFFS